jgi:hypothetical protein
MHVTVGFPCKKPSAFLAKEASEAFFLGGMSKLLSTKSRVTSGPRNWSMSECRADVAQT